MKNAPQCRLTPFEEYMFLDNRPDYPMSCFLKLTFRGRPDLETLEKALATVLKLHPLLQCGVVKDSRGDFFWQHTEHAVEIKQAILPQGRLFPLSDGIDLFQSPALNVTFCEEKDDSSDDCSSLTFEFHHSACDAAGAERFVGDLLMEYVQSRTGKELAGNRAPVDPNVLDKRADFSSPPGGFLRNLPTRVFGIPRALKFLRNRVLPFMDGNGSVDAAHAPRKYPAVLARCFNGETTQKIRRQAKSLGVTINDLLLRAAFLAMIEWKKKPSENQPAWPRGVFRIAVPMNLREEKHRRMPAANIVSMTFLDRQPSRISDTSRFLSEIHEEMNRIKRRKLGLTFIRGLSVYRKYFGGLSRMVDQDRCWSTATVSNLGPLFVELPFSRIGDALHLEDDLELIAVDSVPPIRHLSTLGICALTFTDRMTINMQYDTKTLTPDRADEYFDLFLRHLAACASIPPPPPLQ